jgi:hypothetical protein
VIVNQAPRSSALARALYPEVKSVEAELLEWLAVFIQTGNVQRGNQSNAKPSDFPRRFEDLFEKPKAQVYLTEEQILREIEQFNRAIGRGSDGDD